MPYYAIKTPEGVSEVVSTFRFRTDYTCAVMFRRIYFHEHERKVIGRWSVAEFCADQDWARSEAQRIREQRHIGNFSVETVIVEAWPVREMDKAVDS